MSEPRLRDELRALLPPRVLAYIGVGVILLAAGGPAAVASYRHAMTVAYRYGGDPVMAPWLPLTTDGMIAAALTTIVVRRVLRQDVGQWPIVAALLGFVATIAANLGAVSTASWLDDWAVPIVAVWPPIATAMTLELVVTLLRPRVSTTSTGTHPHPDTPTIAMTQPAEDRPAEPDPEPDTDVVFDPERIAPALRAVGGNSSGQPNHSTGRAWIVGGNGGGAAGGYGDGRSARPAATGVGGAGHTATSTAVGGGGRSSNPVRVSGGGAGGHACPPTSTTVVDLSKTVPSWELGHPNPRDELTDDDRRIITEIRDSAPRGEDGALVLPTARAIRSAHRIGDPRAQRIHRALTRQEGTP